MNYKQRQHFIKMIIWMVGFLIGTATSLIYVLLTQ